MAAARVVIIGGGISGLSAAYYLQKQGFDVTLIEQSHRLGGLIQTDYVEGCRLEAGPDSYIATKPAVAALASELGDLGSQIISANDAARRVFIARNGRLNAMPTGMTMMVPGEWKPVLTSGLFSLRTKLKYIAELRHKPLVRSEDVSIEDFVVDHLGREVLDTLAEPLLSGVYGGEVGKLSAVSVLPNLVEHERLIGSLIRGVRAAGRKPIPGGLFRSFKDGMQSLPDAIARALQNRIYVLRGRAEAVHKTDSRAWRVRISHDWVEADHVVITTPAHEAAKLLADSAPAVAAHLSAIPYSSAILAMFVFDKSEVRHSLDGFGFLVPRAERKAIAAATWVSTKFPTRVSGNRVALRGFIVGRESNQYQTASDEQVYDVVLSDFRRFMGIDAVPVLRTLTRWPASMPQYVVGHQARIARLGTEIGLCDGLHLIGNAYDGVGIPDCIRLASNLAGQLSRVAT